MNAIVVTQLAVPNSPIRDVNLRIPEHSCYGIIGASGSGKSVLLNAIAGLHGTQSPRIQMNGQPVCATTAQIGMMSPRIHPHKSHGPTTPYNPSHVVWLIGNDT